MQSNGRAVSCTACKKGRHPCRCMCRSLAPSDAVSCCCSVWCCSAACAVLCCAVQLRARKTKESKIEMKKRKMAEKAQARK